MTHLVRHRSVTAAELAQLRRPRVDLVVERPEELDRWTAAQGPFVAYERRLDVAPGPDGRFEVAETTDFRLAVPVWRPLITPLMRRALASTERTPRRRWWWPRTVITRHTSELVAVLVTISVMTGYLGALVGQSITFAARQFGSSDQNQATILAAIRVGVILSVLLLRRADRVGRRPMIIGFTAAAITFTALGAASPDLWILGLTQTVARGLTTGLITLLLLAVTEEAPAEARAFAISLLTITAALGAGMVVWVLPVADLGGPLGQIGGWRVMYLVPLLFVPVLARLAPALPETRRFTAADEAGSPAPVSRRWFALLAVAAFASAVFASPASQLRNEYLSDDIGYSAAAVSLFQLVVSAPAGVGLVAAGVLADRLGRRWVAGLGLTIGSVATAWSYQQTGGVPLWLGASVGVVVGTMAFPPVRGYQAELFPTRARARVGGWLDLIGVAGSAGGLLVVGWLATRWDDLGSAIGVMVVFPLLAALLFLTVFPETAGQELEAFNPGDPSATRPEPSPPVGDPEPVSDHGYRRPSPG